MVEKWNDGDQIDARVSRYICSFSQTVERESTNRIGGTA
jgi:hypothetical protein